MHGCASSTSKQPVGRRLDAGGAAVLNVSVDPLRGDVLVAKQLLNRADVAAGFQQMHRERRAERVAGRMLRDAGGKDRATFGMLHHGFVQMVVALLARLTLDVVSRRRKDPLPGPLATGIGELATQRVGRGVRIGGPRERSKRFLCMSDRLPCCHRHGGLCWRVAALGEAHAQLAWRLPRFFTAAIVPRRSALTRFESANTFATSESRTTTTTSRSTRLVNRFAFDSV